VTARELGQQVEHAVVQLNLAAEPGPLGQPGQQAGHGVPQHVDRAVQRLRRQVLRERTGIGADPRQERHEHLARFDALHQRAHDDPHRLAGVAEHPALPCLAQQLGPAGVDLPVAEFEERAHQAGLRPEVIGDHRGVRLTGRDLDLAQRDALHAVHREQAFRGHHEQLTGRFAGRVVAPAPRALRLYGHGSS
jgi:hypothetical protein